MMKRFFVLVCLLCYFYLWTSIEINTILDPLWFYTTSLVAQMVKASAYNVGDLGLIPGSGRSPGEENGNPLLPGKSHGQRSLAGYSPWGHKESGIIEGLKQQKHTLCIK